MKKALLALSIFALVVMFAACGGPKADGEKVGKKYCECAKLDGKEKKECRKEYKEMKKELKAKYKEDKEAYKEFKDAMKAAKKCNESESGEIDADDIEEAEEALNAAREEIENIE